MRKEARFEPYEIPSFCTNEKMGQLDVGVGIEHLQAKLLKSQLDLSHKQSSRDVPTYLPQNKA